MSSVKKSKILFLTRWYPPESGHFIKDIARAVSLYCHVTVLVVIPKPGRHYFLYKVDHIPNSASEAEQLRVTFNTLPVSWFSGLINPILYILAQAYGYRILKRQNRTFDLIHVHVLTRTAILAYVLKQLQGIPYVITEYWSRYLQEANTYHGFVRKKTAPFLANHADAVISISRYLQEALIRQGLRNRNHEIIPLAINTRRFTPGIHSAHRSPKRIIHISTFNDKAKNVLGILRAAKILRSRRTDFELHMIGGSVDHLEVTLNSARNIDPENELIFFHPPLFGQDLVDEIRKSCFLVMFSNYETFSAVIQECFSCGIPVIASDAGAVPEYFMNGGGILVEPGDEEALVHAMDEMLDHYPDYPSKAIRDHVIGHFSFELIGKKYHQLYQHILS